MYMLLLQEGSCSALGEALNGPPILLSWHLLMALVVQVRDTERRRAGLGPKCHFFNSFFVNKLFKDAGTYCYANVARWTAQKKLEKQGQVSGFSFSLGFPLACSGQVLAGTDSSLCPRLACQVFGLSSQIQSEKHSLHESCALSTLHWPRFPLCKLKTGASNYRCLCSCLTQFWMWTASSCLCT